MPFVNIDFATFGVAVSDQTRFFRHKPAIAFNDEKYRPINVQQPTDIKIENEFLRWNTVHTILTSYLFIP